MTTEEIHSSLKNVGYCSNEDIDWAICISLITEKPLLIEGAPGVGKTSLAKALAKAMGLPLIRMQMYDGLTDDKVLYDYDYQKQLLTLEAVKPALEKEFAGMEVNEIIQHTASKLDFYGRDFLIERPILRAINGTGRKVLLLDEIDKAPEEIEYMLYEFLESDYSITVPQYGTITCPEDQHPIVFVTSNGYRDLSDAFKRRCNYLYLDVKTKDEMVEILMAQAGADEKLAVSIASCLNKTNSMTLRQHPSISEGVEWAAFLKANMPITKEIVLSSLGMLVKNPKDRSSVASMVKNGSFGLW